MPAFEPRRGKRVEHERLDPLKRSGSWGQGCPVHRDHPVDRRHTALWGKIWQEAVRRATSVTSTIPSLNTSRFSDAPLASKFTSRCRPPAAHFYFLARGEISRSRDLCQICARELLIWTFWQIWGDERTVSYLESTTVEVPIPSLATTFSITYRHFKTEFHSVSFQNFWSAGCVCGINLGFGAVFRHPRHSAAEKLIYTRRSVKQLVLALEEFRARNRFPLPSGSIGHLDTHGQGDVHRHRRDGRAGTKYHPRTRRRRLGTRAEERGALRPAGWTTESHFRSGANDPPSRASEEGLP